MGELQLYLPGILLAYAACLLGLASPGPNVLAVLGTSMDKGRRAGVALALGIAGGSVLWALMTAAGLSALLVSYAAVLTVIKIAGGLYLLWLAFKAFRAAASAHAIATTVDEQRGPRAYVLRGLAIQMTNPKAVLAWIAIMSLGLRPGAPPWVIVAIVVGHKHPVARDPLSLCGGVLDAGHGAGLRPHAPHNPGDARRVLRLRRHQAAHQPLTPTLIRLCCRRMPTTRIAAARS